MDADTIVTALTALTLLALIYELVIQNRLLKAQLLKDRFEMYWNVYAPVSAERVEDLSVYPEDYMTRAKYESSYKDDPRAARKYIKMSDMYDYLAFCYQLKKMRIPDPLGDDWAEKNVKDYMCEKEFMEVQNFYGRNLYPDFARFVDKLAGENGKDA